jgi:hypothetical protein
MKPVYVVLCIFKGDNIEEGPGAHVVGVFEDPAVAFQASEAHSRSCDHHCSYTVDVIPLSLNKIY